MITAFRTTAVLAIFILGLGTAPAVTSTASLNAGDAEWMVLTRDWTPVTVLFSDCGVNICEKICAGSDHKILTGGHETNTDDKAHTCSSSDGDCSDHACLNEEQQEQQEALFAGATVDELRALIAIYRANIVLNSDRRAIQILGCSGDVVRQVPLAAEVVSSLAD